MAAPQDNGWPELPESSPDLPKLEARPTPLELAQAYATLAVHHGQLWPRVTQALEYLRGHLIGAKGEAANAALEVKKLRQELEGQRLSKELGPMRPELPSTIEMSESIKSKVSGAFEQIAKETKGPHVEADPKRLEAVVGQAIDEELAKREQARKSKADADELEARRQADIQTQKNRRKLIRVVVFSFAGALATAAATWSWGKATGHTEGAAEESRRHVPMPSVPAMVVPAR